METPMNFDPNTGAPLTQEGVDIRADEYARNQSTQLGKSHKVGLIIAIIMAVVGVIALVMGLIIYIFFFRNGKAQVALAVGNTYNEISEKNKLLKALNFTDIISDKEYTITVDLDTEVNQLGDVAVLSKVAIDNDVVQISGDIDLSYIPPIEYVVQVDKNQLRLSSPLIEKYLFIYNYHEENDGWLRDYVDTQVLNDILDEGYSELVNKEKVNSDLLKDFLKAIADEYSKLDVKNARSQKFSVNGKEVKCKGYSVIFDKEYVDAVATNTTTILNKYVSDMFDIAGKDIEHEMASFKEMLSELEDTECIFYLYKNEIAAIHWLKDGKDTDILFKGGDYRAENVDILVNDNIVAQVVGSSIDTSEALSFMVEDEKFVGYTFDQASGKFILVLDEDGENYNFDMTINRKNKGAYVDIGYIDLGDTYIGGSLSIIDEVKFENISGEEFDLGKASEEDIQALIEDISDILMGLLGW